MNGSLQGEELERVRQKPSKTLHSEPRAQENEEEKASKRHLIFRKTFFTKKQKNNDFLRHILELCLMRPCRKFNEH